MVSISRRCPVIAASVMAGELVPSLVRARSRTFQHTKAGCEFIITILVLGVEMGRTRTRLLMLASSCFESFVFATYRSCMIFLSLERAQFPLRLFESGLETPDPQRASRRPRHQAGTKRRQQLLWVKRASNSSSANRVSLPGALCVDERSYPFT